MNTYIVTARHRGEMLVTKTWELEAPDEISAEARVRTTAEVMTWPAGTAWSTKLKKDSHPEASTS